MRTLVDLETYHREEEEAWERGRRRGVPFFALYFGGGMALVFCVVLYALGDLTGRDAAVVALICLLGGVVASAVLHDFVFTPQRRKTSELADRVYAGDPEVLPPPPPADEYPFRLPCAAAISSWQSVGGVLYLGLGGFLFVPHLRNAPALRQPVAIGPARTIVLQSLYLRTRIGDRLVAGRYPRVLLVRWQGGAALFHVPAPAERLIEAELARWKFDAPPAA